MLLDIVVVVLVGFATAGVLMLGFRLFGRKPPKMLTLSIVALAIIGFNTHFRYGWADRAMARLQHEGNFSFIDRGYNDNYMLEPWTKFYPMVSSLVAVNLDQTVQHPTQPQFYATTLVVLRQDTDSLEFSYVVDCARRRWVDLAAVRMAVDSDDRHPLPKDATPPEDAPWETSGNPPALFDAVCPAKGS